MAPSQPSAIAFNLNDDLQGVAASQTLEESITSSAAKKSNYKYENPFNSSIDAFSLKLKPQQPAHIEFKAEELKYEEPTRKYRVDMDS